MTTTGTYTDAYTVLDIRHVLSRFNANLRAIAQVTTCMSEEKVQDFVHDLQILAEYEYLVGVDLILVDVSGQKVRARAYAVSTEAWDWSVDLPGANLWPRTPAGSLDVVVTHSKSWTSLSAPQRAEFRARNEFKISWVPTEARPDTLQSDSRSGPQICQERLWARAQRLPVSTVSAGGETVDLFELRQALPDGSFTAREHDLVGFAARYERLKRHLRLLVDSEGIAQWSQRHYRVSVVICRLLGDRYPLNIFEGDVGTGKTVTAESIANRLAREDGAETQLYKLSTRVRRAGRVGQMSTLINQAFDVVARSAGQSRRTVLIIDEADSLAATRAQEHSHHEDKVAVNTLIQKIDDARRFTGRVLVFLCTNRFRTLDPAIARRAALIEPFRRPNDDERAELFQHDLADLGLTERELAELVNVTGPSGDRPGWTYSDPRTRLYPEVIARVFLMGRLAARTFLLSRVSFFHPRVWTTCE
ncbi:MAG TPA: AAA family ATPase [bacterium]|nr:AAA family ATPase [bacterium]